MYILVVGPILEGVLVRGILEILFLDLGVQKVELLANVRELEVVVLEERELLLVTQGDGQLARRCRLLFLIPLGMLLVLMLG